MPAAMLFLRTPGGISHHPDETVEPEDVATALETFTMATSAYGEAEFSLIAAFVDEMRQPHHDVEQHRAIE